MLINCPKCGFSQPKDRYCASCGVDMEQFRPAPPSIWKQIWVSPIFLVGLTLAVVMASVVFIRQKQSEEIASRAELLRAGPVIVEPSPANTPVNKAATEAVAVAPETAPAAPKPANEMNVASTSPAPSAVAAKAFAAIPPTEATPAVEAKTDRAAAAATRKVNMVAIYAAVPKAVLAQLEEEAQASGQYTNFGDFHAGALPDIASHLRGVKVVQRVTKTFEAKANQQRWFVGTKGGDEAEIGMTTLVTLEPSTDGHTHGQVELLTSLPEEGELIRKSTPISSFDLAPHVGWMIHLADLPKTLNLGSEAFGTDGFLSLFRLPEYMREESKFTLFLDFDSSNP